MVEEVRESLSPPFRAGPDESPLAHQPPHDLAALALGQSPSKSDKLLVLFCAEPIAESAFG